MTACRAEKFGKLAFAAAVTGIVAAVTLPVLTPIAAAAVMKYRVCPRFVTCAGVCWFQWGYFVRLEAGALVTGLLTRHTHFGRAALVISAVMLPVLTIGLAVYIKTAPF